MAVCLKPRLIQRGLRIFESRNNTNDIMSEMERFKNTGKITCIKLHKREGYTIFTFYSYSPDMGLTSTH